MKRYYITDRQSAGGLGPLLEIIREQIRLGVDLIQIREKDISGRELFDFSTAVLAVRHACGSPAASIKILLNSRSDIALAAGCDGVHLPASAPREHLPGLLVGRSCHSLEEVRRCTADFVTFGPVFQSPGKSNPVGLSALHAACQFAKPVFALGGITWENAPLCVEAGATGVAGIRLFQNVRR